MEYVCCRISLLLVIYSWHARMALATQLERLINVLAGYLPISRCQSTLQARRAAYLLSGARTYNRRERTHRNIVDLSQEKKNIVDLTMTLTRLKRHLLFANELKYLLCID